MSPAHFGITEFRKGHPIATPMTASHAAKARWMTREAPLKEWWRSKSSEEKWRAAAHAGAWLAMGISAFFMFTALPAAQAVEVLREKVEAMGVWAPVAFAGFYILAALVFLPSTALTLAGGAVFGFLNGLILVSVASTAAAAVAFLIARYAARPYFERLAQRRRALGAMAKAVENGGWKVIALARLSPVVPYTLGNYVFGVTPVSFWLYLITTWASLLPWTILYVYLGYIGIEVIGGRAAEMSALHWGLLGAGLVLSVVLTVYTTRLARQALDAMDAEQGNGNRSSKRRGRPLWPVLAAAVICVVLAAIAQLNKDALADFFGLPEEAAQRSQATAARDAA